MGNYVGGDIVEITYNHPTIGSGTIFCKSNEDGNLEPGGYRSNDDDNASTGDGKRIDQLNWQVPFFEAPPIAWDMTDFNEQDKLSQLAGDPVNADWTITHISGQIWGGKGKPVGQIPGATNSAQVTLKLAFDNKLKPLN